MTASTETSKETVRATMSRWERMYTRGSEVALPRLEGGRKVESLEEKLKGWLRDERKYPSLRYASLALASMPLGAHPMRLSSLDEGSTWIVKDARSSADEELASHWKLAFILLPPLNFWITSRSADNTTLLHAPIRHCLGAVAWRVTTPAGCGEEGSEMALEEEEEGEDNAEDMGSLEVEGEAGWLSEDGRGSVERPLEGRGSLV